MIKTSLRQLRYLWWLLALALLSGCATDGTMSKPSADVSVRRIAVVPFQKAVPEDINVRYARHPLPAGSFSIDQSATDPEKIIENLFMEKMTIYPRLLVHPTEKAGGIFMRIAAESLKSTVPEVMKKVGEELQVEAMLVGYLYRWRELKGRAYSAEKPASVAFDIYLFRVKDGALLWRGFYDQTQMSLMENMLQMSFFFKEGGRWLTVEELARAGMDEVLKTFPAEK